MSHRPGNSYGMKCPHCGESNQIDVAATIWVRLCRGGTDIYEAANGDQEWNSNSATYWRVSLAKGKPR